MRVSSVSFNQNTRSNNPNDKNMQNITFGEVSLTHRSFAFFRRKVKKYPTTINEILEIYKKLRLLKDNYIIDVTSRKGGGFAVIPYNEKTALQVIPIPKENMIDSEKFMLSLSKLLSPPAKSELKEDPTVVYNKINELAKTAAKNPEKPLTIIPVG